MQSLTRALARILSEHVDLEVSQIETKISRPPSGVKGDFSFPCFKMKGKNDPSGKGLNPSKLRDALQASNSPLFEEVTVVGPYVNMTLSLPVAAEMVLGMDEDPPFRRGLIMVEFSQPNTHKAFHIGHLRNLCLGDALVRVLREDGHQVVSANYYGDLGAHVAKCLWNCMDDLEKDPPTAQRGEWLGRRYEQAHRQLEEWEEQAGDGDVAAASRLAAAKSQIQNILQRIESEDPSRERSAWLKSRSWSIEDFEEVYRWCGVRFDAVFSESDVHEESLQVVEEHLSRGDFVESEGAVGVFHPEISHMTFFMLRKKDGTGLYATKDIALALRKFRTYPLSRSIVVADARQSDHFRHVALTLRDMGMLHADRCEHLSYEMVELPSGPMATRKGNVILFRELRERMVETILSGHLAKHRGIWPDEEMKATAQAIAVGALRYGMLMQSPQRKIVFEMDAWLDLNGDTGPYLQYAYARACSILRKCGDEGKVLEGIFTASLREPQERELVILMGEYSTVVHQAAEALRPHLLTRYLFDLAKAFHRFVQECPVKPAQGHLLQGRLLIVDGFVSVLGQGLKVLGIPAPLRM